ncbi:MAG: class I SAM-dependent methyltransferase [Deltaproteobacteria bacterium]|nr:class I SAM-dependent methyltransferase [Deltaproteobacteria bacterium]
MASDYSSFYEEKALTYPERDEPSIVRYEKALDLAQLRSGHLVLDVACKDAVLLDLLETRAIEASYTGLDISTRVIAKNVAKERKGRFVVEDVVRGTAFEPGSFDRVFALEILEHVPAPTAMLAEVRRVLKDDGRLLISVPNPYYYMELVNEIRGRPDTDGHLFAFTDANLRALLGHAGFEVEDSVGTYLMVPRKLRGAFRDQDVWILRRVPRLLACSRVYRARKRA